MARFLKAVKSGLRKLVQERKKNLKKKIKGGIPETTGAPMDQPTLVRFGYHSTVTFTNEGQLYMAEPSIHPLRNLGALGEDLITAVYDWITTILSYHHQEGSYGTIAELRFGNQVQTAIILGFPFPDVFMIPTEAPIPPRIGLLVRKDAINPAAPDLNWVQSVKGENRGRVYLDEISVGLKGELDEAGSFGGWWRQTVNGIESIFGLTCHHCLPDATPGRSVVSPSTKEVTGVLQNNLKYSNRYTEKGFYRKYRDQMVNDIMQNYTIDFTTDGTGVELNEGGEVVSVIASGSDIGKSVVGNFEHNKYLLPAYNQALKDSSLPSFILPEKNGPSALDWILFESTTNRIGGRIGGNILKPDNETISGIGYLLPNMTVTKTGRSTGVTEGLVNGFVVQQWTTDKVTTEIGIIGRAFGRKGDSGAAVIDAERLKIVAMLIGLNLKEDLCVVTPITLIIEDIARKFGHVEWL